MAEQVFGEIPRINEGDKFDNRAELRQVGIHLPLVAGIDGNQKTGASSIVLNGGYVDDLDLGDKIIYTGHGGNNSNTKRQIADQTWEAPGNKGLLISEMKGLPVRVTRGPKHKTPFSPKVGYEYGGLYYVTDHFEEIGKDGYRICRYVLEKAEKLDTQEAQDTAKLPQGKGTTSRVKSTTLRVVRDTELAKAVKQLYDHTCQVCSTRIAVRGVPYAEAAHIKPLGRPHNGSDTPDNILCLCPNHHVMFDIGAFSIDDSHGLVYIDGYLKVKEGHVIDTENLKYHREKIFIND